MSDNDPPKPVHIAGTRKGEELLHAHGREPGRDEKGKNYRDARDSTGIAADERMPIDPKMPQIPPS